MIHTFLLILLLHQRAVSARCDNRAYLLARLRKTDKVHQSAFTQSTARQSSTASHLVLLHRLSNDICLEGFRCVGVRAHCHAARGQAGSFSPS